METLTELTEILNESRSLLKSVKKETKLIIRKLYWMNIKISNNQSVFRQEERAKADFLYDACLSLEDRYDDILKIMGDIIGNFELVTGNAEKFKVDDCGEDIEELKDKVNQCVYKIRICLKEQHAVCVETKELENSLRKRKKKKMDKLFSLIKSRTNLL